ncbi:uncharacterized protein [Centroberyx affinis]|uniref:uncharacterized protein n=1 Tax=Centroberyx affinis TaxID=166261 RepID=UPI003A5C4509
MDADSRNMIRWIPHFVVGFLLLNGFPGCCSAPDLVCTVTQNGNRTHYHVPDQPPSADCVYDWANGTGYNIATEVQKDDESVLFANVSSLTTYGCLPRVRHSRSCGPERRTAVCDVNCTSGPALELKPIQNDSDHTLEWLVVGGIIVALICLLVLVLCNKDRICRAYGCVHDRAKGYWQKSQDQAVPPGVSYSGVAGEEQTV